MIEFEVQDMTCKHCEATITKAIKEVAADAVVDIDLATHTVKVGGVANADRVEAAIRDAGYSPVERP
ncbi:heavy-metal-associated domain-containing protein [Alcaligenaceae bacterium]|uniref:heavy-metal-associated domain-containing protein n=1 Tax=Parapusillimonas sp. JC17 TaxID=3445768 RepID=UPI0015D30627|nr:heavy-metal-associated domain-containing protein [Alcaligenaceae bacterium]